MTAGVNDALRLGCAAVGFTIYPGSSYRTEMYQQFRELAEEAKAAGLVAVMWSYPRGSDLSKEGETAIDITAYAAHMAALLGAHIIKVKPPTEFLEQPEAKTVYEKEKIDISSFSKRIQHVVQSCFAGRRIVVFSGGDAQDMDGVLAEVKGVDEGGGNGSIIGRNTFQRPREEALHMLDTIIQIYQGKSPSVRPMRELAEEPAE